MHFCCFILPYIIIIIICCEMQQQLNSQKHMYTHNYKHNVC